MGREFGRCYVSSLVICGPFSFTIHTIGQQTGESECAEVVGDNDTRHKPYINMIMCRISGKTKHLEFHKMNKKMYRLKTEEICIILKILFEILCSRRVSCTISNHPPSRRRCSCMRCPFFCGLLLKQVLYIPRLHLRDRIERGPHLVCRLQGERSRGH